MTSILQGNTNSWRESVCGAHARRRSSLLESRDYHTSPIIIPSSLYSNQDVTSSPELASSGLSSLGLDFGHLHLKGSKTSKKAQAHKSIPNERSVKLDKHLPGHRRVNVNSLPRPLSRANSMPVFSRRESDNSDEEDVINLAINSLNNLIEKPITSLRQSESSQATLTMVSPILLGKKLEQASSQVSYYQDDHQDPDVFRLDVYTTYLANPKELLKSPVRPVKTKGFSFTAEDLEAEMAEDQESRGQLKSWLRQMAVDRRLDEAIAASERAHESRLAQLRKKSVVDLMLSGEAFQPKSPLLEYTSPSVRPQAPPLDVPEFEVVEMQESDDDFELDTSFEEVEIPKPKPRRVPMIAPIRAPRRRRESFHTTQPYPKEHKENVMNSVGNIPMPPTGNLPTNPNLSTPEAQTLYGQQWLLTQKTCSAQNPVRNIQSVLDGLRFTDTKLKQPATWKCAPLKLCEGVLGVDELTLEELRTCENLRLLPVQYLHIKDIVLTTAHHVGFFRKGDARSWFKMDVTKFGRIYDWFEELEWFPWCKGHEIQPFDSTVEAPLSGKVAFCIAGLQTPPTTWKGCLGKTFAGLNVVGLNFGQNDAGKPPLIPIVPVVLEDVVMVEKEDKENSGTWQLGGMVGIPNDEMSMTDSKKA